MSVFGSLFTAVSGLSAQSQSLGMISNNIANVSTVGYKKTDAAFTSLVTTSSRNVLYSPGSVRAIQNARVNQQGILQQSTSPTDIAITGNGFFVVKASATDTASEPLYTRAGSFSEDATGTLRNAGGYFLMGWPIDQNGTLPSSQADISSLKPVNVAFLGGLTKPTSQGSLALNLKSDETAASYPLPFGTAANYTRGLRVYDSLGAGHDLSISFNKVQAPSATVVGNIDLSGLVGPLSSNGFANTDTFNITIGAVGPTTITLNGDINDLIADINDIVDVNGDPVAFASLDANGYLSVKARSITDNIVLADGAGTPLAGGLGLTASIGTTTPPTAPNLLATPDQNINPEGWWNITVKSPAGATITSGMINFQSDGKLNAPTTTAGQVLVGLQNIDWTNGSDLQNIDLDISGLTQFSGDYNVVGSTQNGAALGLRTSISIDEEGFVTAQFSNGESSKIYKLALATFSNPNGLDDLTGNVFRQSDGSGDFNLREAGKGSAGKIQSGALESSNVDLADEFSKMIVTQRAYSANTKVISTADQMTQELLQLR